MEGDIHEEACFGGCCSARLGCPAATAVAGGRAEREAMGSGQTAGNGGTQSHRDYGVSYVMSAWPLIKLANRRKRRDAKSWGLRFLLCQPDC